MGVASIVVGIAAFLFVFGGFITSVIPFLGTLLSFGAPLLAIAGIVMGGLALSRAKRDGDRTGAPTAGLIINIVALIPALVIALTCGLCNACVTASVMSPTRKGRPWWLDGGGSPLGPMQAGQGSPFGPQPPGPTAPLDAGPGGGPPPAFPPPAFPPPAMRDDPAAPPEPPADPAPGQREPAAPPG